MRRIGLALSVLLLANTASFAHYNMLFPDKPWANKEEKVTFTYQFGHPFEHELSDAPRPEEIVVLGPKGKIERLDVKKLLTPIMKDGADGKKVTAWQFPYTPPQRGDFYVALKTAVFKHDGKQIRDFVKVALHVQTQNGWDNLDSPFHAGMDIQPYTRPYGILPGMAFKGRVAMFEPKLDGQVVKQFLTFPADLPVEMEKYNLKTPKKLPPDELITFKAKLDHQGYFTASFPEPGWWGVTAVHPEGGRATLWVHVDEKK